MIETVSEDGETLAVIVRAEFRDPGVRFFTPNEFSQQLAYMHRPTGHLIEPHVHNSIQRDVRYTQEVLVIRSGTLRVDFYASDRRYLHSRLLRAGDVILLAAGGHGFEVIEEVEMIEIKQGPYAGDLDKTRFPGATPEQIRIT